MERLTDKNHNAINNCGEYSSCYSCHKEICYIKELEEKLGELEDVLEKYGIDNLDDFIKEYSSRNIKLANDNYALEQELAELEAKLAESERKNFELLTKLNLKEYAPAFCTLADRDCEALGQIERLKQQLAEKEEFLHNRDKWIAELEKQVNLSRAMERVALKGCKELEEKLKEVEGQYAYECECNKQFVECQNENEKLKAENERLKKYETIYYMNQLQANNEDINKFKQNEFQQCINIFELLKENTKQVRKEVCEKIKSLGEPLPYKQGNEPYMWIIGQKDLDSILEEYNW